MEARMINVKALDESFSWIKVLAYGKSKIFSWLCIFLICINFVLCINQAKKLNMDKNPSTWAVYAIPHSLSEHVFKHDKKYTSNRTVRDTFTGILNSQQHKNDVNAAING